MTPRIVILMTVLAVALSGCGSIGQSRLNPFNWFRSSPKQETLAAAPADQIRLAFPRNDDFADFRRLLDLYLDTGTAVYIAFDDEYREVAAGRRLLEGLEMEPLYDDHDTYVARVVRRRES